MVSMSSPPPLYGFLYRGCRPEDGTTRVDGEGGSIDVGHERLGWLVPGHGTSRWRRRSSSGASVKNSDDWNRV
jgi:hypothetical protein